MPADRPTSSGIERSARLIYEAYRRYDADFREITHRARARFAERDWAGAQADRVERLELWERVVARTAADLRGCLGSNARSRAVWHRIKEFYGARIDGFNGAELARTFFTTVNRRTFDTVGVDPLVEFVLDLEPEAGSAGMPFTSLHVRWGSLDSVFEEVLRDRDLGVPLADPAGDARRVRAMVEDRAWRYYRHPSTILRVEMLVPVFYQSHSAFLVGKVDGEDWSAPFAIELEHEEDGPRVTGVYMSDDEAAVLFGFTRSYFSVDIAQVRPVVDWLRQLMPDKSVDELYSVLGRVRQGKTERYRALARHLDQHDDRFVPAPGTRGMVMIVFTLPGHHLVFKVIRDRFAPPKKVSREQVIDRYRLVSRHDRVGRMIDTQAFRNLAFDRGAFSEEVLAELASEAAGSVRIERARVVFEHVYMERRVRPLNLYLPEVSPQRARSAVVDYGLAIREMALVNIFPGDMLLKNFGVTRHGRVVFYDFDEVSLLTDCTFRKLPRARDDALELAEETWFQVRDGDVFPEQFRHFLGLTPDLLGVFEQHHADLLAPAFWRDAQRAHREDVVVAPARAAG